MTIIDSIVILVLLCGAVLGFKKGAIKSLVTLIGLIVLVIVSYYLKNPVAGFMYKFLPFFKFGGSFEGLVTLNILLYESIAYFIVFAVLSGILSFLIKVSGILERILKATIILSIPSKIIGAVLGFFEALVLCFIVLFVLIQINGTSALVKESDIALKILDKTPLIGNTVDDTYQAVLEIIDLQNKYQNNNDKDAYNGEILSILLNYNVIDIDEVQYLIDKQKLDFKGVQSILNSYKEVS